MKSFSKTPAKKQDPNKKNPESGWSLFGKKSVYADNPKSRNYKYGDDSTQGPNFNRLSKYADGDTTSNAGVFK